MSSARFYELSTSGLNFDRFVDQFDESTLVKMRRQYWTAKQLIRTKLGKKEDEYLLASDADFDAKIALFRSLRDTSGQLLFAIDDYQHYLIELVQSEIGLSNVLKEDGEEDKTEAGKAMIAVGRAVGIAAQYRLLIRTPLLRFLSELQVFIERAIQDCGQTVEAAEKARIEYRGSLLWMKKTSNELDPETENIMEKFRTAQNVVRQNKEKFDGLKLDTLQKVDLLTASRCNLLSQLLETYQNCLFNFYDQSSSAYSKIYSLVSGYKHYQFEILKDLMDPEIESDEVKEQNEELENSLIDVKEEDLEMKTILLDFESTMNFPFELRPDSPLGLVDDQPTTSSITDESKSRIGPLPEKPNSNNIEFPTIAPPPGWKVKRNETNYSNDLMELLGVSSNSNPETEWKEIIISDNLPVSQCSSTTLSNLPSQLLDSQNISTQFPNPFTESDFDMWNNLISEYEKVGGNTGKRC